MTPFDEIHYLYPFHQQSVLHLHREVAKQLTEHLSTAVYRAASDHDKSIDDALYNYYSPSSNEVDMGRPVHTIAHILKVVEDYYPHIASIDVALVAMCYVKRLPCLVRQPLPVDDQNINRLMLTCATLALDFLSDDFYELHDQAYLFSFASARHLNQFKVDILKRLNFCLALKDSEYEHIYTLKQEIRTSKAVTPILEANQNANLRPSF